MPYLYSTFYESSVKGIPVARSLALDHPFDPRIYGSSAQYQFLFGDALMVVPVTPEEKSKTVYLPKGGWYDLFTDQFYNGNQDINKETPAYTIPLFAKASAIIPVQGLVQSTRDKASDTLQIHIYKGTEKNSFVFYEDEGEGTAYQQGNFARRIIAYDPAGNTIQLSATEGQYPSAFKKIQWVFHGFGNTMPVMKINGQSRTATACMDRLLDPLQELEDYYGKEMVKAIRQANPVQQQWSLVTDNKTESLIINW